MERCEILRQQLPYFKHAKEITNATSFDISVLVWFIICFPYRRIGTIGSSNKKQVAAIGFAVFRFEARCLFNELAQSGQEIFMSRIWSVGFVFATMTGAFATSGFAQSNACNCPCNNGAVVNAPAATQVQSYQRYSYQPAAVMPTQVASGTVMSQPSVVYAAPQAQGSYRRFSYQPSAASNQSGLHKEAWQYSKPDPRRQQH